MKTSRQFTTLFPLVKALVVSWSLVFTTTPISFAIDWNAIGETGLEGLEALISGYNDAQRAQTQQLTNQQQQMAADLAKAQQAIATQQQSISEAMNTIPRTQPAKYFPECQIFADTVIAPKCGPIALKDDAAVMAAGTKMAMADNYASMYNSIAQESVKRDELVSTTAGVSCLRARSKALDQQLNANIEALQADLNAVKGDIENFKKNAAHIKAAIKDLQNDLDGGTGDKDAKGRADKIRGTLKNSCGGNLPPSVLTSSKDGLRGVQTSLIEGQPPLFAQADKFTKEEGTLRKDTLAGIDKIGSKLSRNGLRNDGEAKLFDGFGLSGPIPTSEMKAAYAEAMSDIQADYGRLANNIATNMRSTNSKIDINSLMVQDGNFAANMKTLAQNAPTKLEHGFMQDCVFGDQYGRSTSAILQTLQLPTRTDQAMRDTTARLRSKLSAIFSKNSAQSIDEVVARVRTLEEQFGEVYISLPAVTDRRDKVRISDFIEDSRNKCRSVYTLKRGDKTDSTSVAGLHQKILADINELKSLAENSTSKIKEKIKKRVMDCEGAGETSARCEASNLLPSSSSKGFCFKQASACSKQVKACHAQVTALINQRETEKAALATEYNRNAENLMKMFMDKLGRNAQAYVTQSTQMASIFQVDFKMPENLFLENPPIEKKTDLGVYLFAKGDDKWFEDLPKKLASIKAALENQREKITGSSGVVSEYIDLLRDKYLKESQAWKEVSESCLKAREDEQKARDAYRKQVADEHKKALEQAQKDAKAENAARRKAYDFCTDLKSLAANPTCDKRLEELIKVQSEVSDMISSDASAMLREIQSICNSYMGDPSKNDADGRKEREFKDKISKKYYGSFGEQVRESCLAIDDSESDYERESGNQSGSGGWDEILDMGIDLGKDVFDL